DRQSPARVSRLEDVSVDVRVDVASSTVPDRVLLHEPFHHRGIVTTPMEVPARLGIILPPRPAIPPGHSGARHRAVRLAAPPVGLVARAQEPRASTLHERA